MKLLELKHLITFKQVAQTLNFSRAAKTLNYAQPTVSAHIQALEAELGVALFNRLGKQITLTQAGEKLLTYARQLTELADEARLSIGQIGEAALGAVRVGASESILAYRLPPLLRDFQSRFPAVRLVINPVRFDNLLKAVRKGQIDLALAFREAVDPDLSFEILVTERLALVSAPQHRLAQLKPVTPVDLAGETLLAPSLDCPYRLLFKRVLADHGVEMTVNYQFGSTQPIKQFAAQGGGIALLPEPTVSAEVQAGMLVRLNWTGADLCIPIVMVWHPKKWEAAAAQMLKDYLRQNFNRPLTSPG